MTTATVFARAQLEGWLVANVGSVEAEECLRIVGEMIQAERDAVINTNMAMREKWRGHPDAELFSLRLSEALIKQWGII